MKLYAIFDKVSKKFNMPYPAENNETASRSFVQAVKDNPFKDDFELYVVGSYESDNYAKPFDFEKPDFVLAYFQGGDK